MRRRRSDDFVKVDLSGKQVPLGENDSIVCRDFVKVDLSGKQVPLGENDSIVCRDINIFQRKKMMFATSLPSLLFH
jgi:hypothetical protein